MNFLKRLGRALLDMVTSKKAIAAAATAIAGYTGAPVEVVAAGIGYVVAQGVADRGKEAEKKKAQLAEEAELIRTHRAWRDKNGRLVRADPAAATLADKDGGQ